MYPDIVRRIWEQKVMETLERRPQRTCDYVLLRSEQVIHIHNQVK
jgi:hypothetical protein